MKLAGLSKKSLSSAANYVDPRGCVCSVEPANLHTQARFMPYVCACGCAYGEANKNANFAIGKSKG